LPAAGAPAPRLHIKQPRAPSVARAGKCHRPVAGIAGRRL